jgi:hypothetical protein
MTGHAHWGHSCTYTYLRGRVRVQCSCSKQRRFTTLLEAESWGRQHTGINEKKRRDDVSGS